jgi:hypothetical protein
VPFELSSPGSENPTDFPLLLLGLPLLTVEAAALAVALAAVMPAAERTVAAAPGGDAVAVEVDVELPALNISFISCSVNT